MSHDSMLMGIQLPTFWRSLLFPSTGWSNYVPIFPASYPVTEAEGCKLSWNVGVHVSVYIVNIAKKKPNLWIYVDSFL
jgi:hypothetical protein